MQGKVGIGPASWLGWLAFLAGQITAAVIAAAGSKADLYGPGKWAAIGGFASLIATNLGRQLQAATGKGTSAPSLLPSDLEELEPMPNTLDPTPVRRETSAVPDGAEQAPPPESQSEPPPPDPMSDVPPAQG